MRHENLNGRCGICEFRSICKGCRARALAATGNQMDEDAWCNYVPGKSGNEVIQLATSETFGGGRTALVPMGRWCKNLSSTNSFLCQGHGDKNIEQFAAKNNYQEITQEVMRVAREEMLANKEDGV